jgi:hypothetical protein
MQSLSLLPWIICLEFLTKLGIAATKFFDWSCFLTNYEGLNAYFFELILDLMVRLKLDPLEKSSLVDAARSMEVLREGRLITEEDAPICFRSLIIAASSIN